MVIPKVAIGIPVYNGSRFVRSALESLLRQSFEDFTVLISDNDSTDDTIAICKDIVGADSRFKIVKQSANIGAVPNFNWLVRNSSSRYFKWAAADDILEPSYLSRCVAILDSDSTVGWCHCRSDMIDEFGASWIGRLAEDDPLLDSANGFCWWAGHPRQDHSSESRVARFRGVLLGTTWSVDSYGLMRRKVLNQTRLIEPLYGAEKVFMAELSLYGKYHHISDLLFSQRVHSNASGNIQTKKNQQSFAATNNSKIGSSRFALLRAHLHSIARSNLSRSEKIQAYLAVAAYLLQMKKWSYVAKQVFHRRGVGGGGADLMNRATDKKKGKI